MNTPKPNIDIEEGAFPEKHELLTAHLLAKTGHVQFLAPSRIKNSHTPDILWLGKKWEIKAPEGNGRNLIHNTLSRAAKQSENIIIDFRRLKVPDHNAIRQLRAYAPSFKKVKCLKIITQKSRLIDIKS